MRVSTFALGAALSAGLLAGCAGTGGSKASPADPAQALRERAQARWNLLVKGEFAQAWEYFSPGYRSTTPRDIWAQNMVGRPVKWKAARATEVDCPPAEQYCDVTVSVDFVTDMPLSQVGKVEATSPVVERWIESGGSWYFVPKEVAPPR